MISGADLAQHRDAAGGIVAVDEIDRLGKFRQPGLDRRSQVFDVLALNGVVAAQLHQLFDVGKDGRNGGLVLHQKTRLGGQEIAARGALGPANLQQQGGKLVFHLDRVHDPAIVLA